MRLDDDGSGPAYGDENHSDTTWYTPNGLSLNANLDSYVVVPEWALSQGVIGGDLAFVIGNGWWTPAIVGDFGSSNRGWGELSLGTAWNLGVPTVGAGWPIGPVIPDSFGPVQGTIIVIPTFGK